MNKKTLQELKEKLKEEKERLEKELKSLGKKDPDLPGDYDAIFPDFGDRGVNTDENADEVEEYVAFLDIGHSLESQLQDTEEALKRIQKGHYGICENCGKKISVERLYASPEARICLKCK